MWGEASYVQRISHGTLRSEYQTSQPTHYCFCCSWYMDVLFIRTQVTPVICTMHFVYTRRFVLKRIYCNSLLASWGNFLLCTQCVHNMFKERDPVLWEYKNACFLAIEKAKQFVLFVRNPRLKCNTIIRRYERHLHLENNCLLNIAFFQWVLMNNHFKELSLEYT